MSGTELRTADDITHDLRSIVLNDNFVPEITLFEELCQNFRRN